MSRETVETLEDPVASGDKAASRWTGKKVHRASGTAVTLSGMLIVRVRDGLVVEGWNSIDFLPMLTTLNLIPEDAVERALAPT